MSEDETDTKTASESPKRGPKKGAQRIPTSKLPRRTLEECVSVPKAIHEVYAGGPASWDELAGGMGAGAKSDNTKYLIWGALAYELILQDGEKYNLSETGRKILAPNYAGESEEGKLKAITIPTILSRFYTDYDGQIIPEDEFLANVLESRYEIPRNRVDEAKRIIIENAAFAEILLEHANGKKTIRLEKVPTTAAQETDGETRDEPEPDEAPAEVEAGAAPGASSDSVCFYITPIGDEGSEIRKHSDMMLRHLIEPAFTEFGITVVRADKIGKSGLISQQVFENVVSSKFCVADMSFGNPNAFYELGVRHMTKLPTIQIIRKGDKIPFDVAQGRTIIIDLSDIYTIMDKIASARNELIEHIRNYLDPQERGTAEDNPVSIYLPGLQVRIPTAGKRDANN
ncbi:hypothetical protein [Aidingimonas lacisalsi]|uniref:hypothetical protein n=1 Tax=Aidingimonas lacisalsi TaxID=2604086 RepID=UPI0011D2B684|nr:hypothetical protein [Aidingimonas lacisalsi]